MIIINFTAITLLLYNYKYFASLSAVIFIKQNFRNVSLQKCVINFDRDVTALRRHQKQGYENIRKP